MGVPRQEQPVKIWGVAGQTSWTKGDFPRRREEQTALRPHSAEAPRKRYERNEVARKKTRQNGSEKVPKSPEEQRDKVY
ncbi:hypothetical protein NDU88_002533 [Pleurodeles waltl]|uniref:Uncharacterized protein n=1 Tax=Pleurodeles waltl TaxID=8319 RepID=A0AAV7VAT3_PLEWA|nr:hypothetical protein NDU88_002533 [Pleurodeles waltl]